MNNIVEKKPTFTEEQLAVINADPYQNMIVIAVPGAGKTTCLVARIKHLIDIGVSPNSIIALTYSKSLGDELRAKTPKGLKHVGTIDSLCYKYLDSTERQNKSTLALKFLDKYVNKKIPLDIFPVSDSSTMSEEAIKYELSSATWVFYDEGQDLDETHKNVLEVIAKSKNTYITIIADPRQTIYQELRGANPRYMFELIRPEGSPTPVTYYLNTNFRSSPEIIQFINKCHNTGYPEIICSKNADINTNRIPELHIYHAKTKKGRKINDSSIVELYVKNIKRILAKGISPEQIAILAPSVKNSTFCLLNAVRTELVSCGLPDIQINTRDTERVARAQGHLYAGTIHSAKGLEWDAVILANFYKGSGSYTIGDGHENLLFVAVSRAKKLLFLMETIHYPINCGVIDQIINHQGSLKEIYHHAGSRDIRQVAPPTEKTDFAVTELLSCLTARQSLILESHVEINNGSRQMVSGAFPNRFKYVDHALYGEFLERVITRFLLLRTGNKYRYNFKRILISESDLVSLVNGNLSTNGKTLLHDIGFNISERTLASLKKAYNKSPDQLIDLARAEGLICSNLAPDFMNELKLQHTDVELVNSDNINDSSIVSLWNLLTIEYFDKYDLGVYQINRLSAAELNPSHISWDNYLEQIWNSYVSVIGIEPAKYQRQVVYEKNGYIIRGIYDMLTSNGIVIDIKTYQNESLIMSLSNMLQIKAYHQLIRHKESFRHTSSGRKKIYDNVSHGYVLSALTGKIYRVEFNDLDILEPLMRVGKCLNLHAIQPETTEDNEIQYNDNDNDIPVQIGICLL